MVFDKTDFLFWGWLKAFLGFEFYHRVSAAATMSVMSHIVDQLSDKRSNEYGDAPQRLITVMPGLLMLCFIAGFVLVGIPTLARQPLLRPHGRSRERDRWDGHSSASPGTVAQLEVHDVDWKNYTT